MVKTSKFVLQRQNKQKRRQTIKTIKNNKKRIRTIKKMENIEKMYPQI